MARSNVRQHARRTPGGGTTTVRQHGRAGRPRRGVTAGHAWQLAKKAFKAGRQNKKGLAALLAAGAAAEFTLWGALRLGSIALGTAGIIAITVALGGLMLAGWRPQ
jgi:hypothetical protein